MHMIDQYAYYLTNEMFTSYVKAEYGKGSSPFTYVTFLQYHLEEDSWGDEAILQGLCNMWGVRASVIKHMPPIYHHTIRHAGSPAQAELCLLLTTGNHYSPIGKSTRPCVKNRSDRSKLYSYRLTVDQTVCGSITV